MPFTYDVADVILKQLTPVAANYIASDLPGRARETTGSVIPVDINLAGNRANSSGCEAADFAGLDFSGSNDIALLQRGTCSFLDQGPERAERRRRGRRAVQPG